MKFKTLLSLGYLLVFGFVVVLSVVTYFGVSSLRETSDWVSSTQKIISKANLLEKLILDMETGVRGYLLTGKQEELKPHQQGDRQFHSTIKELKALVSHNPDLAKLIDEIGDLEDNWHEFVAEPQIKARERIDSRQASMAEIAAEIEKGTSKEIMNEIRDRFRRFINAEKELLAIREKEAYEVALQSVYIVIFGTILTIIVGVAAMMIVSRSIFKQVGGEPGEIAKITGRIAKGELDIHIEDEKSLTGIFASVRIMLKALRANNKVFEDQDWLKSGIARLNDIIRGEQDIDHLAQKVISEITSYMGAQVGALYLLDSSDKDKQELVLAGTYAYKKRKIISKFKAGEGLVGQACAEKRQIMVKDVPEEYVKVAFGGGEAAPRFMIESPFMFENRVVGVIETGSLQEISNLKLSYLEQAVAVAGISFNIAHGRKNLEEALKRSQEMSEELQLQSEELQAQQEELQSANEELQSQQEELRTANEELEEQAMTLKRNEESLISQQEKLRAANEELEEKTDFLEKQRAEITEKNNVLEKTSAELETKAKELEISSRYKSEFLANMSHELRTPLNSILLLSRDLAQNKDSHLDEEELESAEIVYKSGNDLLNLIDDILNLSKIEAGKMTVNLEDLSLEEFSNGIKLHFAHLAKEKGLDLEVKIEKGLPESIQTDPRKLDQIIRNLISNACKFTESGKIDVSIGRPTPGTSFSKSELSGKNTLAISVRDTGIGIPEDKQREIFEAFQQADGSTSRKYGGTGLGLSISRELSRLLGGEIQLKSTVGKGSVFTLMLPENTPEFAENPAIELKKEIVKNDQRILAEATIPAAPPVVSPVDEHKNIRTEENSILIVEDDPVFLRVLEKQCREQGLECMTAQNGREALEIVKTRIPKAIILDIRLPEKDGWEVLDELKKNPNTQNIPVHVMSGDDNLDNALSKGVVGTLRKPISKEDLNKTLNSIKAFVENKKKTLLIVEDNENQVKAIKKLISREDMEILAAGSGEEAVKVLTSTPVDCMVLDLTLPDISGFELLDQLSEINDLTPPPVVVYTGRDLSKAELAKLEEHSETVIIKGAKSAERLLDETALFLHQVVRPKPSMIANLHEKDNMLKGKKVMVVDDDMRNVFALSKILKHKEIIVLKAENGKKALTLLEENPDVDLVLMDIMMPEMNGYETIRRIRDPHSKVSKHDILIFALTAKAMKKDREKCIEAGANDYLSKPVDVEKLFSMMRVWLYK